MEQGWSESFVEAIGYGIPKHSSRQLRIWLERLGDPDLQFPQIHVAGTNGKGSVCRCLSSSLEKAGLKTGLFTSPHLVTVRERFVAGGEMISSRKMDEICAAVRECTAPEGDAGKPSYFEFIFLMAMVYFAREKVDAAVIEAGVGGRTDATNVIRRKVLTVITPVGRDHMAYLGETVAEIASHKAGIIQKGVPLVYASGNEEADRVIRDAAERAAVPFIEVHPEAVSDIELRKGMIDFSYAFRYDGRERLLVPGNAPYQARNAACAAECYMTLKRTGGPVFAGLTRKALAEGLRRACWPGRMEEILPDVYLDGAHNEHGIRGFLEAVRLHGPSRRRVLLFAVKDTKDSRGMVRLLSGEKWDAVFLTDGGDNTYTDAGILKGLFPEEGSGEVSVVPSFREAFERALDAKGDGLLFICGSLYLTGEIKEILYDQL